MMEEPPKRPGSEVLKSAFEDWAALLAGAALNLGLVSLALFLSVWAFLVGGLPLLLSGWGTALGLLFAASLSAAVVGDGSDRRRRAAVEWRLLPTPTKAPGGGAVQGVQVPSACASCGSERVSYRLEVPAVVCSVCGASTRF